MKKFEITFDSGWGGECMTLECDSAYLKSDCKTILINDEITLTMETHINSLIIMDTE